MLKFEQTSLFYIASYLNSGGDWNFVSEGLSPSNTPHGYETVWLNFSLLFHATDSETYLVYAICQACKIHQTFCLWAWQGPKWHNAFRYCSAVMLKLWYAYH